MSEFNSKFIKYLCLLLFLKGCAYFNTFYNAEEHFDLAERIRIENLGNQIPSRAIQEYGRAIDKSEYGAYANPREIACSIPDLT